MSDQAKTLRERIERKGTKSMDSLTRVISFTSGKGGVGKSHLVANTAVQLAQRGKEVLVLDADLGLANLDVLLGMPVQYTLQEFFAGQKSLAEIVIEGPEGIALIPAASGIESICNLSFEERTLLMQALEDLAAGFDYLLIDTPAGIGPDVLYFNCASQEVICVITPEPTSLTDAYALIKVLSKRYGERTISIVVNNVSDEVNAQRTYRRLEQVVQQYLQVRLEYRGFIPADESVRTSIQERRPIVLEYPSSQSARAIDRLAQGIEANSAQRAVKGGVQLFFQQLITAQGYGEEAR